MWQNKSISVVFPAYNEEENIDKAVSDFKKLSVIDELIVVDNNSTDKTAQIAKTKGAKVIYEKKQGYGYALRRGMKEAKGDFVVLAEPDGTFNAKDTLKLLRHIGKFDLVLGTRTNIRYIKKGANMGFLLRFGNILMAKVMQILFWTNSLSDCGCTLRVIKKDLLQKMLPKMTVGGSHFLPETVILTSYVGGRIKEIPVRYGARVGTSKITGSLPKAVRVGLSMFLLMLKYRFQVR